ncbi:MAG: MGH1-like glycoside hydrolase domain-containing protein, partial [Planctomycetota bacterium]
MNIFTKVIILMILLFTVSASAQDKSVEDLTISFEGKMPQGLVGNGKSIVTTDHDGFGAERKGHGRPKKGRKPMEPKKFIFSSKGINFDLSVEEGDAEFFPGGTIYSFSKGGTDFEVFHAALENEPYIAFIRFNSIDGDISIHPEQAYKKKKAIDGSRTLIKFSKSGEGLDCTWDELKSQVVKPYAEEGMVLECPSENISKAVAFNQYLLDLGYNGRIIVCELFRYRDIWSRDMGSGFGPGALFSNRITEAKNCISYDLARYEEATATALKTTGDASRGGSAEGTAFLTITLWEYYKVTGDRQFLKRCAEGIRPWVEAWLDRDYNKDGLIIDVTEWMDHSRFFLLAYGSSTLYSNALMVELLTIFSDIEKELGNANASIRYRKEAQRFSNAINDKLWSPELNAYANLYQNGTQDLRTASAANALAVLAGVSSPERTQKIFASLEKTNWRPAGSMTITPLMTHNKSDQNEKIWPWWNALESRARFLNEDPEGGVRILENCAATINNEELPGLIEETLSKDGETEGGNSFPTAAGSFLVTVYKGLFGVEILSPGMKKISVKPNLPASWKSAKLRIPTAGGHFTITVKDGTTTIDVADTRIEEVAVREGVAVNGAKAVALKPAEKPVMYDLAPLSPPEINERNAVVFTENGLNKNNLNLPLKQIGLKELGEINESGYSAVIFPGNAVPAYADTGEDMRKILESFVDKGGAVIFYGITMRDRGKDRYTKMGGQGGVIEWYKRDGAVWAPIDIKTGEKVESPVRGGTVYWGKGPYFNSWDVSQGM